jgi:hypothetical protein
MHHLSLDSVGIHHQLSLPLPLLKRLCCLLQVVGVVNCNLQRLDGPVRGNGKIIQELESLFRGAGWRVNFSRVYAPPFT